MYIYQQCINSSIVPVIPDDGWREPWRLNHWLDLTHDRTTKSSHSVVDCTSHKVLHVPTLRPTDRVRVRVRVRLDSQQDNQVFSHRGRLYKPQSTPRTYTQTDRQFCNREIKFHDFQGCMGTLFTAFT